MLRLIAAVSLVVGLVGCGPVTRADAREAAAQKACAWYQECGDIGPGLTFEDRDECAMESENTFNALWDNAACSEIEREDLEVCLTAIESTQCDNALDFLNTIFNRCSVANVCGG